MKKGLFALLLLGFLAISLSSFRPPGGLEDNPKVEYSISENESINQDTLVALTLENPIPLLVTETEPIGGFISEVPFIIPTSNSKDYRFRWGYIRDYNTTLIPTLKFNDIAGDAVHLNQLHKDPGRRGC